MSRASVLAERNNVECPRCESVLTRSRGGGRADTGERLRRRVCDECRLIFTTVEVPLLYDDGDVVPLSAIDSEYRWYHRTEQRKRVKYHGTRTGRLPYVEPARLSVKVRVTRPVRKRAA